MCTSFIECVRRIEPPQFVLDLSTTAAVFYPLILKVGLILQRFVQ